MRLIGIVTIGILTLAALGGLTGCCGGPCQLPDTCGANPCRWWDPCDDRCAPIGDPCDCCDPAG